MSKQEFPRVKIVIGVSSVLAAVLIALLAININNPLVVTGLSLDIVGASVLALPDLPRWKTQFRYGKLERCQNKLVEFDNITRTDDPEEFEELIEILVDLPVANTSDGFSREDVASVSNISAGSGYGGLGVSVSSSSSDRIAAWNYSDVSAKLNENLTPIEGRIRRSGIAIITLGFGLQLISAIVPQGVFA